jgi:hypothetical protein
MGSTTSVAMETARDPKADAGAALAGRSPAAFNRKLPAAWAKNSVEVPKAKRFRAGGDHRRWYLSTIGGGGGGGGVEAFFVAALSSRNVSVSPGLALIPTGAFAASI